MMQSKWSNVELAPLFHNKLFLINKPLTTKGTWAKKARAHQLLTRAHLFTRYLILHKQGHNFFFIVRKKNYKLKNSLKNVEGNYS